MYPVPEWLEKWEQLQLQTVTPRLQNTELYAQLQKDPKAVAVVDLRNEQEHGTITLAIHIPATEIEGPGDVQEKLLAPVLRAAPEARRIVIHCNLSGKRASYVGGWAEDHLAKYGPRHVQVEILHGGIVGWLENEAFASETSRDA